MKINAEDVLPHVRSQLAEAMFEVAVLRAQVAQLQQERDSGGDSSSVDS